MDFTSKDPATIANYIRFWLGDLSEAQLSSDTMLFIINLVSDNNPSYSGCDLTFYSAVDILKWLTRKQNQGSTGGAVVGTGEIKRYSQRVGSVETTTEYDVGTSTSGGSEAGWEKILADLLDNPNSIGCTITQGETTVSGTGNVIIGGSSIKEATRVNTDTDSRNGYSITNPFRSRW